MVPWSAKSQFIIALYPKSHFNPILMIFNFQSISLFLFLYNFDFARYFAPFYLLSYTYNDTTQLCSNISVYSQPPLPTQLPRYHLLQTCLRHIGPCSLPCSINTNRRIQLCSLLLLCIVSLIHVGVSQGCILNMDRLESFLFTFILYYAHLTPFFVFYFYIRKYNSFKRSHYRKE